jgi:hypothetical protein
VTAVKVSDKTCRHTDYDAFPCDSWFAGGHAERYDPPFMYGDTDDLATQKPTGFQVRRGRRKECINLYTYGPTGFQVRRGRRKE